MIKIALEETSPITIRETKVRKLFLMQVQDGPVGVFMRFRVRPYDPPLFLNFEDGGNVHVMDLLPSECKFIRYLTPEETVTLSNTPE